MVDEDGGGSSPNWDGKGSLSMRQFLLAIFAAYYCAAGVLLYAVEAGLSTSGSELAEPLLVWNRTLGEKGSYAEAAAPSRDGGIIVAGTTRGFGVEDEETNPGKGDHYLLRISQDGEKLWESNYGGVNPDGIFDIVEVKGGGFIAVGSTFSFEWLDSDVVIFRIDEDGEILWNRTYGNQSDGLSCITEARDRNFIAAGSTRPPDGTGMPFGVYILRIDDDGEVVWETTMEGQGSTSIQDIVMGNDGGYLLVGYSSSQGTYLLNIDEEGNKIWEATYGGGAYSVTQNGNEGYVIAGGVSGMPGEDNLYLFAVDNAGNTVWQAPLGAGTALCVTPTANGFLAAGYVDRQDYFGTNIKVLEIDGSGSPLWERAYRFTPDTEYADEHAISIVKGDGSVYIVCNLGTEVRILIMKMKIDSPAAPPEMSHFLLALLLAALMLVLWRSRMLKRVNHEE